MPTPNDVEKRRNDATLQAMTGAFSTIIESVGENLQRMVC